MLNIGLSEILIIRRRVITVPKHPVYNFSLISANLGEPIHYTRFRLNHNVCTTYLLFMTSLDLECSIR